MNKEEWLLQEVDNWKSEKIIDNSTSEKLKKRYELYNSFNDNILDVLFMFFGIIFVCAGAGLFLFANWGNFSSLVKLVFVGSFLGISYLSAVFVLLLKPDSRVLKEVVAIMNTFAMFWGFAMVIKEFRFDISMSNYLLISTITTLPVLIIMNAVSPIIVHYSAILIWGTMNFQLASVLAILVVFLIGASYLFINFRNFDNKYKYMIWLSTLMLLPILIFTVKLLKGNISLAILLYCTLLFSARDINYRVSKPFRIISTFLGFISILFVTLSQTWIYNPDFGGIPLGFFVGIILLGSFCFEIFNTKDDNYEFYYLVILMLAALDRYIWCCLKTDDMMTRCIFMMVAIVLNIIMALGFVNLGKDKKSLKLSAIGFLIIGFIVLTKLLDNGIDFIWRAIGFLGIGVVFIVLLVLSLKGKADDEEAKDENKVEVKAEARSEENVEETAN